MPDQTVVAPPPAPPAPPAAYEFSKTENATIERAATWAKALAVMFFISTAVQVINLNILGILVDLAIGVTFWKGANLLDAVVDTEDDDVSNMLGALGHLQTAFTIRIIITAVAAAIGLVLSVGFFVQYKYLREPVEAEPAVTVEDAEPEEDAEVEEDAEAEEDAEVEEDAEAEEDAKAEEDAPAGDAEAEVAPPAEEAKPAEAAPPAGEGAGPA